MKHSFEEFLDSFIPLIAAKSRQLNKISWILETTGSKDAADLRAEFDTELRFFFNDRAIYNRLIEWTNDRSLTDFSLKRQLNILVRAFKQNMIPKELLSDISKKESELSLSYTNFRPKIAGKEVSDNEIRDILKNELDPKERQKAWEASKEIGNVLAPQILALVKKRNEAATELGYVDYFQMQLELQEVDGIWLFEFLEALVTSSEETYADTIAQIEQEQSQRFGVDIEALGPWAWAEPFCQEDPTDAGSLDSLVANADICDVGIKFYERMGIDVLPIERQSDMYEREGKNQHAFCINIDRSSDVRTLNNVKPTIKWLETVLHEYGHAIYEIGFDDQLPWLLREPPHMITTEAMALLAGRQAYLPEVLSFISNDKELIKKAGQNLKRRQLIFSRWVLVMTYFERELYHNPDQDLNKLWWSLVDKYQKIRVPKMRETSNDWAAKYHIGLAPVYYYSYLLGEVFASAIEEILVAKTGSKGIANEAAGVFLQDKLFAPGNRMSWSDLICHVTGDKLDPAHWINHFC